MTLAIVQHVNGHGSGSGSPPGAVTLGAAPTAGNLLLAWVTQNPASTAFTLDTTKWTLLEATGSTYAKLVYRYVQVGDTATLPAFGTAGATFWAATVYEISGVSATIGSAVLQHETGVQSGSTTPSIANMTTANSNEVALVFASQYNGTSGSLPSFSAGWTRDEQTNDFTNYGVWGAAHQLFASSSSTVSCTITQPATASNAYGAVRLTPASNAGTGTLAFGGISLAAAGSVIREETGLAALHFAGLSIVANGSDITGPAPPTPPPGTTKKLSVDPLTWNTPIVNPDGTPKPEFQQKWNKQNSVNSAVVSQDYIDTQDAANTAANQKYTQDYGATVLAAAKAYSDSLAVTSGDNVVTMTAAANLNGNFFVKADASGNAAVPDLAVLADGIAVVGITQGAIASGSTGPVQTAGIMSDPSWSWTPGGAIYVGASGLPTQSVPSSKWVLQGGVAVGATTIDISLRYVISTPL